MKTHTLTRTHIHSYTHAHTLSLSHTYTHTRRHTYTYADTLSLCHYGFNSVVSKYLNLSQDSKPQLDTPRDPRHLRESIKASFDDKLNAGTYK